MTNTLADILYTQIARLNDDPERKNAIYQIESLSRSMKVIHEEQRQLDREDLVSKLTDTERLQIARAVLLELSPAEKLETLELLSRDPEVRLLLGEKTDE